MSRSSTPCPPVALWPLRSQRHLYEPWEQPARFTALSSFDLINQCNILISPQTALVSNTVRNIFSLFDFEFSSDAPLSSWRQTPWIQNLRHRVGTQVPRLFVLTLLPVRFHQQTASTFSFKSADRSPNRIFTPPTALECGGEVPSGSSVGAGESCRQHRELHWGLRWYFKGVAAHGWGTGAATLSSQREGQRLRRDVKLDDFIGFLQPPGASFISSTSFN